MGWFSAIVGFLGGGGSGNGPDNVMKVASGVGGWIDGLKLTDQERMEFDGKMAGGTIKRTDLSRIATYIGLNGASFPATTAMLFYQATAPTGWTESGAALENHALRVCSVAGYAAAGGTGTQGTNTFDAVLSDARNAGATTLTSAQSGLPAHTHGYNTQSHTNGGNVAFATAITTAGALTGIITANAAANASSSHTHTLDFAIKYANIIICAKD